MGKWLFVLIFPYMYMYVNWYVYGLYRSRLV